jgi:hypothetical protein
VRALCQVEGESQARDVPVVRRRAAGGTTPWRRRRRP